MLAMHPQNNNHDIISEHELKKKNLSVQKVTKTRCFNEMDHRGKNFCQFFFYCLKAEKYESICICFW